MQIQSAPANSNLLSMLGSAAGGDVKANEQLSGVAQVSGATQVTGQAGIDPNSSSNAQNSFLDKLKDGLNEGSGAEGLAVVGAALVSPAITLQQTSPSQVSQTYTPKAINSNELASNATAVSGNKEQQALLNSASNSAVASASSATSTSSIDSSLINNSSNNSKSVNKNGLTFAEGMVAGQVPNQIGQNIIASNTANNTANNSASNSTSSQQTKGKDSSKTLLTPQFQNQKLNANDPFGLGAFPITAKSILEKDQLKNLESSKSMVASEEMSAEMVDDLMQATAGIAALGSTELQDLELSKTGKSQRGKSNGAQLSKSEAPMGGLRGFSGSDFLALSQSLNPQVNSRLEVQPTDLLKGNQSLKNRGSEISIENTTQQNSISNPNINLALSSNLEKIKLQNDTLPLGTAQGSMGKSRMSTDSVQKMSQWIQQMGMGNQLKNGQTQEVNISLKPENLGQLNVRIASIDGKLHLSIRADRPEAKAVIEESIGSLRETLLKHQMQIASLDVQQNSSTSILGSGLIVDALSSQNPNLTSDSGFQQKSALGSFDLSQQSQSGSNAFDSKREHGTFSNRGLETNLRTPVLTATSNAQGRSLGLGRIDVRV